MVIASIYLYWIVFCCPKSIATEMRWDKASGKQEINYNSKQLTTTLFTKSQGIHKIKDNKQLRYWQNHNTNKHTNIRKTKEM